MQKYDLEFFEHARIAYRQLYKSLTDGCCFSFCLFYFVFGVCVLALCRTNVNPDYPEGSCSTLRFSVDIKNLRHSFEVCGLDHNLQHIRRV